MRLTAVACVVAIGVIATLGTGAYVHFDVTHQDCDHPYSLIDECDEQYYDFAYYMPELLCTLYVETIACIETAQCHCDWGSNHTNQIHGYWRTTHLTYLYNNECANTTTDTIIPPLDLEPFDCAEYNMTAGDRALELATMNHPGVISLEETCDGIQYCYSQYDVNAALALYQKDLHGYCTSLELLLDCATNATCACNQNTNKSFEEFITLERRFFFDVCGSVFDLPSSPMYGFMCPGAGKCNSSHPTYECDLAWIETPYYCQGLLDLSNCTENVVCECRSFQEAGYYELFALLKYVYEDENCEWETGSFPDHTGIDCGGDEELFTMTLAQAGYNSSLGAGCAKAFDCYNDLLQEVSEAYRTKDLHAICTLDAARITCLESAYCECGVYWEPDIQAHLQSLKWDLYFDCQLYGIDTEVPDQFCLSCNAPDPLITCKDAQEAVDTAFFYSEYCPALISLANCTEHVACECEFFSQSIYYREFAIAKFNFENEDCHYYISEEFPSHDGLSCAVDDAGQPQTVVSIAMADSDFVREEDMECPGIKECYEVSDAKSVDAYHEKNLTAICEIDQERILCVEEKYCQCGKAADEQTVNRTVATREEHLRVCYDATGILPVPEKCRNGLLCSQTDPLLICEVEYDLETRHAYYLSEVCRAFKNYMICYEDMGCLCGLLSNGSSEVAHQIYSTLTIGLGVFENSGCPTWAGDIVVDENGIQCADQPDDDELRELVLNFAESPEVLNLTSECFRIQHCFRIYDSSISRPLESRDYTELCQVEAEMIGCMDEAYCRCGINGTTEAEDSMDTQIDLYDTYCSFSPSITRMQCEPLVTVLEQKCDSLKQCADDAEQKLAQSLSVKDYDQFCRHKWKFVRCVDEAFCACGLDGTKDAEDYREMQLFYHEEYCLAGNCAPILPAPMTCELQNYDQECDRVKKCHDDNDDTLDDAVCTQATFCQEKKKLIVDCLDKAICGCRKNGTPGAMAYRQRQVVEYRVFCVEDIEDAKDCDTGAAGDQRSFPLVLILVLLAGGLLP